MPKTNKIIQSFNAGELSKKMDSRTDQAKYLAGCRTMENFIPMIYGGAEQRPGTQYIAGCKSNSAKSRVVAFEHSVDDTYILEFANQVIRVYKDGAVITGTTGTETIKGGALDGDNLVAQWKMNDNAASTAVDDEEAAVPHDGIASTNTDAIHAVGPCGSGCFDLAGQHTIYVADNGGLSFDDSAGENMSISAWVYITLHGTAQEIIAKWSTNNKQEWRLAVISTGELRFHLYDESESKNPYRTSDVALTEGWHQVGMTYESSHASWLGNTAATYITLYVDGAVVASTATQAAGYVGMEDLIAPLSIGAYYDSSDVLNQHRWQSRIDNVALFKDKLSAAEMATLYTAASTYEISTPYLTADLPQLKFEHSADVMYITHPSYEPRRLSRTGDSAWSLEAFGLPNGPFRDENTDTSKTISVAEIGGGGISKGASVTLASVGHAPFIASTTAGHIPSGSTATSKSQTGALFKIVYALATSSVGETLNSTTLNAATTPLAIYKGVTWDFTTNGTWGTAGPSTIVLERSYDGGTTYEIVHTVTSLANKNAITSGTEESADALYRARVTDGTGTGSASIQVSSRDTDHIGVVKITSVTDSSTAIGTVMVSLGVATETAVAATHRWSEGSFSNRRGWPIDVIISPEERLTFAGNASEPLTTWGSVIGDWLNFKEGVLDDDAVIFTLIGSGQQNRIRWALSKKSLILGTVGGEHLLGASDDEEALTPTNVKAKLQTTYGSEDIAALVVNQAILFIQRGGRKVREFLYNFEADAHKADDLTVFSDHIAGVTTTDKFVDMAFQRTPDPTLWCVRNDGEIACMTYERDQDVFSWYRIVTHTNLAGTYADSDFESVAVIYGGAGKEDEVWVTVRRTISGGDVRYIERFYPRVMESDMADMKYLDSCITDAAAGTDVTAAHLKGQTVQVLGDGLVQATAVANASTGVVTITSATTAQVGIGYDSTLKPMKLDIASLGLATTKRINRAIINLYNTVGGTVGTTTSNQRAIDTGTAALFAGEKKVPMPGGYNRTGDIIVQQTDPLPMTVLSLTLDVGAEND